jgi:hypothetical protein
MSPWKRGGGGVANRRRCWQFWAALWVALCVADLLYVRLIAPHNPVVAADYCKIHAGMTRQEVVSVLGEGWDMPVWSIPRSGLIYVGDAGLWQDGATVVVYLGLDDLVEEVHVTREPSLLRQAMKRLGL